MIRNLNENRVGIRITCTDALIRPMQPGRDVAQNTHSVNLQPCESLVVILSNAADSPVTFNSVEGGLLIFYVGEAIM